MKTIHPPALNPCGSCPYRRDVPSGVWAKEEYSKLPEYDRETGRQPPAVFLCHQQNDHLCAGWVAVHNMDESLGLRIAISRGLISVSDGELIRIRNYKTSVPLFSSGAEAAARGKRRIKNPGKKANRTVAKLMGRRTRTFDAS